MGFCFVGQAGLELLTSSDPSTASASHSAGITGVSHCIGPDNGFKLTGDLCLGACLQGLAPLQAGRESWLGRHLEPSETEQHTPNVEWIPAWPSLLSSEAPVHGAV